MPAVRQPAYVLDSHAVVAYLGQESGFEEVADLLRKARSGRIKLMMSGVNLGEVIYVSERNRGLSGAQKTLAKIEELPIEIIAVDKQLCLEAAHIKALYPIAYADCFAAALTKREDAVLVTGDPEFSILESDLSLPVYWL